MKYTIEEMVYWARGLNENDKSRIFIEAMYAAYSDLKEHADWADGLLEIRNHEIDQLTTELNRCKAFNLGEK